MPKALNGSALISYGPALPPPSSAFDGALFYKTDGSGGNPQGLYVFGFVKDINSGVLGSQVAQNWIQAISPDLFVLKAGDVMTGTLTVPSVLKVTQTSTPQRILIGNQDSLGTNNPVIIESSNGAVRIGNGTNWTSGGTLTTGLSLTVSSGQTGITWLGNQIWHAGRMGVGSLLDADKLDGQEGLFYLNVGNMTSGVLPIARGGTGNSATVTGGIVYGTSPTAMATSLAGTVGQILSSNGAASPTWLDQSTLSVGFATTAGSATTATTAGSATTAGTANAVAWTGITNLSPAYDTASARQIFTNAPSSGMTTFVRPSYFFNMGGSGGLSLTPELFPRGSISGFEAYFTSDIGTHQVGFTVSGSESTPGARSMQLAANWDAEELAPTGLRFRVNDDTGTVNSWGAWATIWDNQNLTKLSQLTNDLVVTPVELPYIMSGVLPNNGDVFPPSGYTMSHLVAFIPSINVIYFNGDVDNNDTLVCTYTIFGDRVRISVYNSEQRATGYANYLSVWKK